MSKLAAASWTEVRKAGRGQFVFRYGVLGWGVSTAILFSLWSGYSDGWDGFLFKLIPALALFPLGGVLWGRFMWWYFERMHSRTVSE